MVAIVILFLFSTVTVDVTSGTYTSLPDCQERRISFAAEPGPGVTTVVCWRDQVATFPCHFNGSNSRPQWVIQSAEYSSTMLPQDHYYNSYALTVTNVNNKNGTTYQCQITFIEEGRLCAYKSAIGQLIFQCPEGAFSIHCSPYYNLNSTKLERIQTIVTQLSSPADYYVIKYLDSTSAYSCYEATIPASSCTNGTCTHVFDINMLSWCHDDANITVTASAKTHSTDFQAPNEARIDAYNTFVKVDIRESIERITVNCTFLNQSLEAAKSCGVVYGPNCNNLSSLNPASATVDTSNSVVLNMENRLMKVADTCFEVTASNETKTIKVVYTSGDIRHKCNPIVAIAYGIMFVILVFDYG